MAKRDEAALKLLRWELAGHGGLVLEAMLRHPVFRIRGRALGTKPSLPAFPAPHCGFGPRAAINRPAAQGV